MTATITTLNTLTTLDIPVDKVLEGAKSEVEEVLVIGLNADGELYVASSGSDIAELNLLLDMCKIHLMNQLNA